MGEPAPLKIVVEDGAPGEPRVVRVNGELDFATSPRLLEVAKPLAGSPAGLVVDMAGVTFCDSSGLNTLVRLHKAAADAGGSVRLARLTKQVSRVIAMVSLDKLLVISDEVPAPGPEPR